MKSFVTGRQILIKISTSKTGPKASKHSTMLIQLLFGQPGPPVSKVHCTLDCAPCFMEFISRRHLQETSSGGDRKETTW